MRPLPKLTMLLYSVPLLTLTACAGLINTAAPEPDKEDIVRVLCARNDKGVYIFGPVFYDRLATDAPTITIIQAHNAAWDNATDSGGLCVKWGGTKWGGP